MLITKTFPNITKRTIFFSIFRLAATNFNFILDFNENVEYNLSTCLFGIKLASTSLPSMLIQASCLGRVFKPSASDSRCNSVLCGFSFCFLSDFLPFLICKLEIKLCQAGQHYLGVGSLSTHGP